MKTRALIYLSALLGAFGAIAHPGGLDANGGHTDRATGIYHYHRGPNAPDGSSLLTAPSAAPIASNRNLQVTPAETATNTVAASEVGLTPEITSMFNDLPWWVYLVGLGSGYLVWEIAFHYYQKRKGSR